MTEWITGLFADTDMTRMGHHQRAADLNLGLGFLYYSLARVGRPAVAVVIGSYRGFVPLVLGKALADNAEGGAVVFIDPSLVDDFWKDPAAVRRHFARFGVTNVSHHLATTQQFADSDAFRALPPVGLLFIDGYHSEEQARFDLEAFAPRLTADAKVLFHDSARVRVSNIYGEGRGYEHRVRCLIDALRHDGRFQVLDLPHGDGVSLVRLARPGDGWAGP
ncbi:MAG: class I SAM-dependent methyltransferase [Gemmataceae bacterium]